MNAKGSVRPVFSRVCAGRGLVSSAGAWLFVTGLAGCGSQPPAFTEQTQGGAKSVIQSRNDDATAGARSEDANHKGSIRTPSYFGDKGEDARIAQGDGTLAGGGANAGQPEVKDGSASDRVPMEDAKASAPGTAPAAGGSSADDGAPAAGGSGSATDGGQSGAQAGQTGADTGTGGQAGSTGGDTGTQAPASADAGSGSTNPGGTGTGSTGTGGSGSDGSAPSQGNTGSNTGSTPVADGGTATVPTGGMPAPAPVDVVIPPNCDKNGATQVNLLTTSLENGGIGAYVEYQIFKTDCDGKVLSLSAEKIWFDIDAVLTSFVSIDYALKVGGKDQAGVMKEVTGADLFGNKGGEFGHWETSQAVSVSGEVKYVILRVHLPTNKFTPRVGPANSLPTYLRFGNAAPVTQVIPLR